MQNKKQKSKSATGLPFVSIRVDGEVFELRHPTFRVVIAAAVRFLEDYQARTPSCQSLMVNTTNTQAIGDK